MSREHEGLGASAALMQHAGASWEWQVQRNNDPELLTPGHLGWLGEAEPPSGGFRIPTLLGWEQGQKRRCQQVARFLVQTQEGQDSSSTQGSPTHWAGALSISSLCVHRKLLVLMARPAR